MGFGGNFVEVMATCRSKSNNPDPQMDEWGEVRISPLEPFHVHPCAPVLNYGTCVFEGMKAYYDTKREQYLLFRPKDNWQRIVESSKGISLSSPSYSVFMEAVTGMLKKARPVPDGGFIYIRPVVIAVDEDGIGSSIPQECIFYVIGSYVDAPYIKGDVTLEARHDKIRAWPGGMGDKKFGGNYGAVLGPYRQAADKGFSQVLWLFPTKYVDGPHDGDFMVTEAGVMNFFCVIEGDNGELMVMTPSLAHGLILPGITRLSCLEILGDLQIKAIETDVLMKGHIMKAENEGKLVEMFAVGTAIGMAPIGLVQWTDDAGETHVIKSRGDHAVMHKVKEQLVSTQQGVKTHWAKWIMGVEEFDAPKKAPFQDAPDPTPSSPPAIRPTVLDA